MELHNLKPANGARKRGRRLGRGQGTGRGGTSTRGHKGAKSRSGFKNKRNFEGGQMPLQMRIPKRGFNNLNRVTYTPLNLDRLEEIVQKYSLDTIDPAVLVEKGVMHKNAKVKLLGRGELTSKLTVTVHAASEAAKKAIEEKGGSVNLV